jgi:hypothetical protein
MMEIVDGGCVDSMSILAYADVFLCSLQVSDRWIPAEDVLLFVLCSLARYKGLPVPRLFSSFLP